MELQCCLRVYVDEQIEAAMAIANAFGSSLHAAQVGQVKLKQLQSAEPLIMKLLLCCFGFPV